MTLAYTPTRHRLDGALGEETTLAEKYGHESPGGGVGGRGEGGDGLAISDISVDSTLDSLRAAAEGEVDKEGREEETKEMLEDEMRGLVAELLQERKVASRARLKRPCMRVHARPSARLRWSSRVRSLAYNLCRCLLARALSPQFHARTTTHTKVLTHWQQTRVKELVLSRADA